MARIFNGTNQYMKRDSVVIADYPCSMSCWFKADNITTTGVLMICSHLSDNDNYCLIYAAGTVSGDPLIARSSKPGLGANAQTTTGYTAGVWHLATAVFASSSSRSIWLNGSGKGTDTTSIALDLSLDRFAIGVHYRPDIEAYFAGSIAEACVWNVALTDSEVASLYLNGIGAKPTSVRPDKVVAYNKLLNNDGDIDWWGQNNLTAVNSPTYGDHPPIAA